MDLNSLMKMLANKNGVTREKARKSLVTIGKPAVLSLTRALLNPKSEQLRWEAAKTLGSIDDTRAIPSLLKALEDSNHDVAWLAALALKRYKKTAWPQLLNLLTKNKKDSTLLRLGAHHILLDQKEAGFNELLTVLKKSLEPGTSPELTTLAAHNMINRMKVKS